MAPKAKQQVQMNEGLNATRLVACRGEDAGFANATRGSPWIDVNLFALAMRQALPACGRWHHWRKPPPMVRTASSSPPTCQAKCLTSCACLHEIAGNLRGFHRVIAININIDADALQAVQADRKIWMDRDTSSLHDPQQVTQRLGSPTRDSQRGGGAGHLGRLASLPIKPPADLSMR